MIWNNKENVATYFGSLKVIFRLKMALNKPKHVTVLS